MKTDEDDLSVTLRLNTDKGIGMTKDEWVAIGEGRTIRGLTAEPWACGGSP